MKTVRSLVAAIAAGSALSFGAMALAQDAKQPEAAKPQAKEHQHRHEGMQHMRGRGMSGGCHGEEQSQRRQDHNHS